MSPRVAAVILLTWGAMIVGLAVINMLIHRGVL